MRSPRGNRKEKLNPELSETVRQQWLGGKTFAQIRAWLEAEHGIVASDACLSRACRRAGAEAGEVLYKTEHTVTIVEKDAGDDVDDDAVCALYRNELLKEMQAAKKERHDGVMTPQEWRGTLIQLARASNDVIKTRKLLRAPDKQPPGYQVPTEQQGAEVVFGGAQA